MALPANQKSIPCSRVVAAGGTIMGQTSDGQIYLAVAPLVTSFPTLPKEPSFCAVEDAGKATEAGGTTEYIFRRVSEGVDSCGDCSSCCESCALGGLAEESGRICFPAAEGAGDGTAIAGARRVSAADWLSKAIYAPRSMR